jgi:L-asparaginase
MTTQDAMELPRIAVFSGPTATVLNSPPLITQGGGEPPDGSDTLRAQRLAMPAVVYIEPLTGHPLERDSAELYGPPNCLLDEMGNEHPVSEPPSEGRQLRAVHRVVLRPGDGLFLLPYVATTKSGTPWRGSGLSDGALDSEQRQTFYPDAARLYEEIDRFGIGEDGYGRMLSRNARFDFFRPIPSGGYRRGLPAELRTDNAVGELVPSDIEPERRGSDYFPYYPRHLRADPSPAALAEATNLLQEVLGSGTYAGGQWLEGTPAAEESLYWFSLLLDITVPLVGQVAQRPHGTLSADGARNIVDGVHYITGGAWTGGDGADAVGVVLVADQVAYAAREVAKTDARPGNYVATGGFGGIVGSVDTSGRSVVTYRPTYRFTHRSQLNLSRLPGSVKGRGVEGAERVVTVLDASGRLRPDAMPVVTTFTYGRYVDACCGPHQVQSWVDHCEREHPLVGIVGEGANPYGHFDAETDRALRRAALGGVPVVKCGRGGTRGFTPRQSSWAVSANNLTAPKARILLMAALLKLGALPVAADPSNPQPHEEAATASAVQRYQQLFDSH